MSLKIIGNIVLNVGCFDYMRKLNRHKETSSCRTQTVLSNVCIISEMIENSNCHKLDFVTISFRIISKIQLRCFVNSSSRLVKWIYKTFVSRSVDFVDMNREDIL